MNQLLQSGNLVMSSIEIANLTNKSHKNVLMDIRKMLKALGLSSADFSAQYKDPTNRTLQMFNLPKRECLILVSGYNTQLRAKIIDRWNELETKPVLSIESRIDRLESKFDKLIDLMILRETGKKEEPKPQNLIAAKLEPRDEIRKIINQYTAHAKTSYRQNWNLLYQESYYRLGINFKVRGQRRSKSPLEIAEEMGFIYDLLAIAREIFQLGRT